MNNNIDTSAANMVGASAPACPRTREARVPTSLRSWMIAFVAAFMAVTTFAAYPGNSNFRNVPVMQTATTRND